MTRTFQHWALLWALMASQALAEEGPFNVQQGFVTTRDGVSIHYLAAGPASSDRVVVFLPGWRLPASLWEGQLQALAGTTRCVAIDSRSQGSSSKTTRGNTPEVRADDLHDVLAQLGVADAVLVGWSQGVQDIAAYLEHYGSETLAGVVFVDSPVLAGPLEVDLHPPFAKFILAGLPAYAAQPEEYSRRMVQWLFKKPHPELDLQKIVDASMATPAETGLGMLVVDVLGVDRRPALSKLTKPALVVASMDSPLLQAQRDMASSIPGAKLLALEGTGTAVFIDEPAKFNAALLDFLRGLAPK